MENILIYSPSTSARLQYVAHHISRFNSSINIEICQDYAVYAQSVNPYKINYSEDSAPGLAVFRSGFLDQQGISTTCSVPFARDADTTGQGLPDPETHDVFALIFWCLSRFEEYQPFTPDKFGRFPAGASWLTRSGWLEKPLADYLIADLFQRLSLSFSPQTTLQPTADVDIAFAFSGRAPLRMAGSLVKTLLNKPARLGEHIYHLFQPETDPYNSYTYMAERMSAYPEARVFWHCGKSGHAADKQVRRGYKPFTAAIRDVSQRVTCGLHPSMRSNHEDGVIQEEKAWLEQVTGKTTDASRQHYIYLRFPDTYRSLLQAGISEDYSMGYPDACGFRAGTARPFLWYDLEQESETGLQIHPFCAMDVTCRQYMKLSPEQAIEKGRELRNNLRNTGGVFGFIFHNESLGHARHWNGWRKVFEAWLE